MMPHDSNGSHPWRILAPGKVYFHYGPTSMVVMADKDGSPLTDLCCEAYAVINAALEEITASLSYLRLYPKQIQRGLLTGLPGRMLAGVVAVGEPTLTPMATVAGAVSDTVADWLVSQGASRAMVNNGGDVALRLAPGTEVKLGIMSSLQLGVIDRSLTIRAEDGIGGVATSGLGGRSLTRGIAQGVSVFSATCILADALATHLANCSYVKSEHVSVAKAGQVDPGSDIKDLDVVIGVNKLDGREVKQALNQVKREAVRQKKKGNLIAACCRVQETMLDYEMKNIFPDLICTQATQG